MQLKLANNTLTRFDNTSGYATTTTIPLTGTVATVAAALLAWLGTQLASGESLGDVMLEQGDPVPVTFDELHNPLTYRPVVLASSTIIASLGQRELKTSSEQLPDTLRDGLLSAWATLDA